MLNGELDVLQALNNYKKAFITGIFLILATNNQFVSDKKKKLNRWKVNCRRINQCGPVLYQRS